MFDNIDVEINPDYTMMKKVNGNLYLSEEQMEILKSYNIDYMKFSNLKDLIHELMEEIEENDDDVLENLLDVLSERDYYENYNK
ncbi:unknown [Firmicutes bacterium CAG:582]|nr:unknown [Firmicutes bacterium CAG:582]